MTAWYQNPIVDDYVKQNYDESYGPLIYKALQERTCASHGNFRGKLKGNIQDLVGALRSLDLAPHRKAGGTVQYSGEGELVTMKHMVTTDVVTMYWGASSEWRADRLQRVFLGTMDPVPEETPVPRVHGFSLERGSYTVRDLGPMVDTFREDNYPENVVRQYHHAVGVLVSGDPSGRILLVNGAPGTGKTRMVRSLIAALAHKAMCVIVPQSLMDRLSGPEFTACLLQQRQMINGPLILILEDADDCLVTRSQNASKASLASLLNMSDGILGSALDIRMVATTNQELADIDHAVLRPGRLLDRIHIGPLSASHAETIFHRETGARQSYEGPVVLAQVYEDSRNHRSTHG